jgi:hypothetical protein
VSGFNEAIVSFWDAIGAEGIELDDVRRHEITHGPHNRAHDRHLNIKCNGTCLDEDRMTDVTSILGAIVLKDPQAASQLLLLVYDELRMLAACKMARESAGQTPDATALVHEAYLRLVGRDPGKLWAGRAHFFAAAAEAMRRILVEKARAKHRLKRGGKLDRADVRPTRSRRLTTSGGTSCSPSMARSISSRWPTQLRPNWLATRT